MLFLFLASIVIIFAICAVFVKTSRGKNGQVFGKKEIPQVPGLPYIGIGLEFMGKSSEVTFRKAVGYCVDYNGKVKAQAGHHKWIMVAVPEDIEMIATDHRFLEKSDEYNMLRDWLQDGLLTVGNKRKWQTRRKVLTPAFHFKILDEFVHVFEHQADIFVNVLRERAGKGGFDIANFITLYTLDVICETSMGVRINAQTDEESEYVKAVKELTAVLNWRQAHFLARDDWYWKFTPQKQHHDKLVRKIHDFTVSVIENRKKEKAKSDRNQNIETNEYGIKRRLALLDILLESNVDGSPLSTQDIHEEVDNFMFAGHDTTTSAIEFLLYNLAKYPEIQQKVYNEINEVLGPDSTEPITLSQLNNLSYLDLVIKESLRLFPPVPFIARYLRENVEINGTVYPANHNIILAIYPLHRNEKYFERALEFIPERFLEQKSHDTANAYSYIPFSCGFRNCIGQKFAQYEIKMVLSKILKNFLIELDDGFELRYTYEIILRPIGGIRLKLTERN